MTQRTLFKTIEKLAKREFSSDEELMKSVLDEIVHNEKIDIIGGRIWKLQPAEKSYTLIYEQGKIETIGLQFTLKIKEYPTFEQVAKQRTILASETNKTLRRKGISKYSATGIGERVKIGRTEYYEYLMAFNTERIEESLVYTMKIVSQAVTSLLRNRKSEAQTRMLQSDLDQAWELQRRILPEHEYEFGVYQLYGVSVPDRIVGGDFFNYLPFADNDRLAVAIGDAASKGLSAAVQALFVSGALMMSVEYESKISTTLRRVNNIVRRIFPDDRFLTLFYCELFAGNQGLCIYSNAGHASPIYYQNSINTCKYLSVTGPIIGLIENQTFGTNNINFDKGDILLLYTDGITEANDGAEEFGDKRLEQLLVDNAKQTPKRIAQKILEEVQIFSAHGEYHDDKTILVIKRIK